MTPTEKRIIKILEGQACVSAKAIALELQWNDVEMIIWVSGTVKGSE